MLDALDKAPENLSGGQKQRVAIAGVLAMNPDVVIFDEATAMLDPKGKREISECIKMMREENPKLAILSITHDIEEAANSDYIIVLNNGQIELQGTPKEVFASNKLKEIGLDYPFKHRLAELLVAKGIKINEEKSIEEVAKELCR